MKKEKLTKKEEVEKFDMYRDFINFNKQMKRKKLTRSKLVKKLDAIFSKYIRLKYSDKKGICKCYTCWDKDHWKNMQCGHFVSRSNYKYRRDEKNARVQDYKCNIIYSWNYKFYTCNMIDEYWKDRVDCMINDKEPVKITTPEIEEMIEKYELLVEKLLEWLSKKDAMKKR